MITMDGYYKGKGKYRVITHGEQPDPKALCSFTLNDIHHNIDARYLLDMMSKGVDRFIDEDNRRHMAESINRALEEEGHEPLEQCVIDTILNEIEFQKASEATEDESEVSANG